MAQRSFQTVTIMRREGTERMTGKSQTTPNREVKMARIRGIAHAVFLVGVALSASVVSGETLTINARRRIPSAEAPGAFRMVNDKQTWPAEQTAIIICDMWNRHWCRGATARVKDMAPAMNRVVSLARDKGVLIVHAPSSCMEAYAADPARQRAREASQENLPDWLARWNNGLESEKGATWPIDQSDGGCDCRPQCPQGSPWTSQIDTIDIREGDAISDSGLEIAAVLRQRGVHNVIIMGVHTNMCVIGRPFGLRNMARWGMNVVLMRDLTDTMYNSRRPPY
ncbi:MAG TPA: isochorismatase family protein, partial [Phycisphaerales bacterium]|nr:isochorismatase family protein [Phycisphaerales bacterium]